MAIKEIKPGKGESLFPSFSPQPGVTLNFPSAGPSSTMPSNPHDATRVLREISENRLLEAEYHRVIGPGGGGVPGQSSLPARRFFVDPNTGVISVDLDDPDGLTYKDAVAVSASIKESKRTEQSDEYGGAVNLIRAAREVAPQPQGEQERPRNWFVDRAGRLQYDPENGEMTLSEARALSDSMLATREPANVMTPEKIELMQLKLQMENDQKWQQRLQDLQEKWKDGRERDPRDREPPFLFGQDGSPVINPRAKLGISEIMGFMFLQNQQKSSADPLFTDSGGNTMKLPQWLELKKWEKEEGRRDTMSTQIAGLIEEGRKQMPALAAGLKTMASKRAEQPAEKLPPGEKRRELKGPQQELIKGFCQGCGETVHMLSTPAVIQCKKCQHFNFFGTDEEMEAFRNTIGPLAPPPVEEPQAQATQEPPKTEVPPTAPVETPPPAEATSEPAQQPVEPTIEQHAPYNPGVADMEEMTGIHREQPTTMPSNTTISTYNEPEVYVSKEDQARIDQGLPPAPVRKPTQHAKRRNKNVR